MITIDNATKSYGDAVVVDGVTIALPKGGVTSIIGPNGAGKSTLLSMIGRLLPMDRGRVLVDGLDVSSTASDVLARRLSILRQDNQIGARLTVRDLVAFGRYPYSKGRYTAEDGIHVDRAIGFLGLEDFTDRFLDELSGGQRQRAFIAMVLCQDTDYVLLDEPLNNLDMKHAVSIMRLIRRAAGAARHQLRRQLFRPHRRHERGQNPLRGYARRRDGPGKAARDLRDRYRRPCGGRPYRRRLLLTRQGLSSRRVLQRRLPGRPRGSRQPFLIFHQGASRASTTIKARTVPRRAVSHRHT
jgi:iron complex transport system ATP-binding protein